MSKQPQCTNCECYTNAAYWRTYLAGHLVCWSCGEKMTPTEEETKPREVCACCLQPMSDPPGTQDMCKKCFDCFENEEKRSLIQRIGEMAGTFRDAMQAGNNAEGN